MGYGTSGKLVNPFTATVAIMRHRKQCSPSLDTTFKRRRLSWDFTFFCDIQPILIGLQILLINFILCFLKACMILNVKVVPNDIFKFGGERVNTHQVNSISFSICVCACFSLPIQCLIQVYTTWNVKTILFCVTLAILDSSLLLFFSGSFLLNSWTCSEKIEYY